MGSFKLGAMTLSSLFRHPETTRYPLEARPEYPGRKGHVACEVGKCIFCGICERACPADAIAVDKKSTTWSIDYLACVQCFACTLECPKSCLVMEPALPPVSTRAAAAREVAASPAQMA